MVRGKERWGEEGGGGYFNESGKRTEKKRTDSRLMKVERGKESWGGEGGISIKVERGRDKQR